MTQKQNLLITGRYPKQYQNRAGVQDTQRHKQRQKDLITLEFHIKTRTARATPYKTTKYSNFPQLEPFDMK
jgi:hypothetical protein